MKPSDSCTQSGNDLEVHLDVVIGPTDPGQTCQDLYGLFYTSKESWCFASGDEGKGCTILNPSSGGPVCKISCVCYGDVKKCKINLVKRKKQDGQGVFKVCDVSFA